ncbi:hypothetical protein C0J52_22607 [Blattella germanica]|nr:hypothetical protein C0J52_22607 [Blattella germanica]
MHVIHDDLLPLYMTYTSLCLGNVTHCATKYKLAFSDEGEYGSLLKWYNIFSNSEPILLHKASKETIICFDESKVGLSATSLWFQYGFGKPQGPIKDSLLNGYHVRQFSEYVLEKFGIPSSPKLRSERSIVFFSRKINRRILNEDEMLKMMQSAYQTTFSSNIIPQIYNLDLATNNTKDILIHLTESETVVGMHGSAMILSMFMRPGSVVVELFPFGINPQHVSPIKAMCKLQDISLIYRSWVNTKEENTVTYPNAEALLGGISHLPLPEQEQIASLTEIPAVECCHNAAYLFRMFQDTIVDNSLSAVLRGAFLGKKMYSIETFYENTLEHMLSKWYFPAPVTNISCRYSSDNQTITIMWDPPVNTKNPHYNIAVVSNIKQFSTILRKPELTWPVPSVLHDIDKIDVWIKSTEKGKESIDSYFQCNVVI